MALCFGQNQKNWPRHNLDNYIYKGTSQKDFLISRPCKCHLNYNELRSCMSPMLTGQSAFSDFSLIWLRSWRQFLSFFAILGITWMSEHNMARAKKWQDVVERVRKTRTAEFRRGNAPYPLSLGRDQPLRVVREPTMDFNYFYFVYQTL